MSGNNAYRDRAKILVALFPGIHLRELQRTLNVSFNTARHHVDALFKSGEIEREDERGFSRLYPPGTSPRDKSLFSSARTPTKRLILSALVQNTHLSNKQLSEFTGLAKSTISEQIQCLLDCGIVGSSIGPDTRTTYFVHDLPSVSWVLKRSERSVLENAAERFIDLWDF